MAPPKVKSLDVAIGNWKDWMRQRTESLKKEMEWKEKIAMLMVQEGLTHYECGAIDVDIETGEPQVKIRTVKEREPVPSK